MSLIQYQQPTDLVRSITQAYMISLSRVSLYPYMISYFKKDNWIYNVSFLKVVLI